ncbi:hypothetical protein MLD38_021647 [Melastoma candidum]|uniref:Uncharacterized protein n=1 Tax=Melastoma candidum TaxID=119954 RepID=A0ACB9QIJ3_9MYRT|nr:hypothetical protein MLD38_021647 [Melastoma candidum]
MAVPSSFPEEVLEHIFSHLTSPSHLNAASLVCKSWYAADRYSRRSAFVGNCYSLSPRALVSRFPNLRSVEIKGKPHFADFNLVPEGWGGHFFPWVRSMSTAYPWLQEIRLKRMVVTDDALELLGRSFVHFRVLVLAFCEGFSTDGLAAIAANCRNLRELDLRESEVEDLSGHWIGHFPDSFTSLVSLDISCLSTEVNFPALERLVSRCPDLKSLRLNRAVPLERLVSLLRRAPQLVDFGAGAYSAELHPDVYSNLAGAFSGCRELRSLSGFSDVIPAYIPAVYSICFGLTTLNLCYVTVQSPELTNLINQCPNLQRLWVLDYIEDSGLEAVASTCKDLQELRVFPSDPYNAEPNVFLTEQGLVSVSLGCTKLQSVLYFCRRFSNAALVTIARNRPNLTRFRLCIIEPRSRDYLTLEPLDTGFGAIVENCKDLRRLSLSGLLTDKVFEYIGTYGKKLEMLSVAFAGESDAGLHHILSGCDSLRKLEIRDCPFGDKALLANAAKLETMRSLWMSSCLVSLGACKFLGRKMPRLNVEVIDENAHPSLRPDDCLVEKLYIYRSLAGPRFDMPGFVWTVDEDDSGMRSSSIHVSS